MSPATPGMIRGGPDGASHPPRFYGRDPDRRDPYGRDPDRCDPYGPDRRDPAVGQIAAWRA